MGSVQSNEFARLDENLSRFCPFRQWEIHNVTFPKIANTDLDIAHGLRPSDADKVVYMVLQSPGPMLVWHNRAVGALPWGKGIVRLRCTAAGAQAVILLATVPESRFESPFTLATPTSSTFEVSGVLVAQSGVREYGRTAMMGTWTPVPFAAGNFTGLAPMTWTVTASEVITYAYATIGKTMFITLYLLPTTLSGAPSNEVRVQLPPGFVATRYTQTNAIIYELGLPVPAMVTLEAGLSLMKFYKQDNTNFPMGGLFQVRANFFFEIQ